MEEDILRARLQEHIELHLLRSTTNLRRVQTLINISNLLGKAAKPVTDPSTHQYETLRAAVVLLHATLEDFLRFVGEYGLKNASDKVLNGIPLVGSKNSQQPEKFYLGQLALHRGKAVDDVIAESVVAYLDKISFSSASEIAKLLTGIGIEVSKFEHLFPSLQSMIQRRHEIVHRADLVDAPGQAQRVPNDISSEQVEAWLKTVSEFLNLVIDNTAEPIVKTAVIQQILER